jgi:hypothetical protein
LCTGCTATREFITAVDENRELVQPHRRNQSALEDLHNSERHHAANDDLEGPGR